MWWRAVIAGLVVAGVSELAQRFPRIGALLLTLPLISVIAFIMTWNRHHEMSTITSLARETLILVPLGLPFFVPFALANQTGLSFWPSFTLGIFLASLTIGAWFWLAPGTQDSSAS